MAAAFLPGIRAHGGEEPEFLGVAREIAFKEALRLEVVFPGSRIADFAGELRHLLHVGFDFSDDFAGREETRSDFFNNRELHASAKSCMRHLALHLEELGDFVVSLEGLVVKSFRVLVEGLEELPRHVPVEIMELHVPDEKRGNVGVEAFSIRHFDGSCCDVIKTIVNQFPMHLVYR